LSLIDKAKKLDPKRNVSPYHKDWLTAAWESEPKFTAEIVELVEAWTRGELIDDSGDAIFRSKAQLCQHILDNLPPALPEVTINWLSQRVIPSIQRGLKNG
jgi:hypothetical protein